MTTPKASGSTPYEVPAERPLSPTFLVDGVRASVDAWRANAYEGASATTRRLFTHWFDQAHSTETGQPFRFFFCQREAVETFAFLTELKAVKSLADLMPFAARPMLLNPFELNRPRLAFKMATGSGKTLAMAACIAYSYFHSRFEDESPHGRTFLVLAPNLIVYERLRADFGDAAVFRSAPLVPPEWHNDFHLRVVLQDEAAPELDDDVLYLTNIQRLYSDGTAEPAAANPVDAMIGRKVNRDVDAASAEALFQRIARHKSLTVLNDEAHHVWSEKMRWNQTIERLHDTIQSHSESGVVAQLDFSATPKDQQGNTFRHVVVDYPLAQAVADGVVKVPVIGEVHGATVKLGDTAVQKYRQWLDVAIARWRLFHEALAPAGKQPVLFVMAENTQAADEVADYLRQQSDFAGDRLLVIHTNLQGEITKKDLDLARRAAREVDLPGSPVRCIVSVLMLREGWDVRNVCVIVTLRSLTAKSKILPEQALGRGLRRMTPPGSGYDERVVVIEHEAFRDLWSAQLDGGLMVDREDADKIEPGVVAIFPDAGKSRFDIAIPELTRAITRSERRLSELSLEYLPRVRPAIKVPQVTPDEYIEYRGMHLIDKVEIERERFSVPYVEDAIGVTTWYTKAVARAGGVHNLAGAFAALAPLVKQYLEERVFKRPVNLSDMVVLRRLAEGDAQAAVIGTFRRAILALALEENESTLEDRWLRLSETPAFPWSRETVEAKKTVFNLTPADNKLEASFSRFLDRARDVAAFAKLTMNNRFALEYIATGGALRYYYPDFVVRLKNDDHYILETKGMEDVEVDLKSKRAQRWCADSTDLSGTRWEYFLVRQTVFQAFTGDTVEGLLRMLAVGS